MAVFSVFSVFFAFALLWAGTVALIGLLRPDAWRKRAAVVLPLAGVAALFLVGPRIGPGERLLLSCAGMLYLLKGSILLRRPRSEIVSGNRAGLALYLTVWPGMDPAPFRQKQACDVSDGGPFVRGAVCAGFGAAAVVAIALALPFVPRAVAGFLGIFALLLFVHLGAGQMLPWLIRWAGFKVGPLFDRPLQSATLAYFWGKRWNRAFVEMNRLLFYKPLHRRFGPIGAILGVFAVSGLLHEGGLSYPAWGGWGKPLTYFLLHGALVAWESGVKIEQRWSGAARTLWVWGWLLIPLPLLFHAPFQETCILPLYAGLHDLLTGVSLDWYLDKALWLAGIGHFVILIASFQVPSRLNWKEDFQHLTRFNRKIFWTYGGFIVLSIVSFGVLTLFLHNELLRGDRAALGLAGFNAVFWLVRLATDFFYFKHDDWPKGPQFVVGHVLLTCLFIALATTYTSLVIIKGVLGL